MRSEGLRWGGFGDDKALTCLCLLRRGKQVPWDHRGSQGFPGTPEIRYGADGEGWEGAGAAPRRGWGPQASRRVLPLHAGVLAG